MSPLRFFFLLSFNLSVSSSFLPNGCSIECSFFQFDQFETIECSGGNFKDIMKFVTKHDIPTSELFIENCNPPISKLEKLPTLNVSTLRISGCKIEEIDEDAFENVHLQELDLRNNSIIKFPQMVLKNRLKEINLDYNKIGSIPKDTFTKSDNYRDGQAFYTTQ